MPAVVTTIALVALPLVAFAEDPLTADELLKLDGPEFVGAAERASFHLYGDASPYKADELIALADKLVPDVKSTAERLGSTDRMSPFGWYFKKACLLADDSQIPALVALYSRLDPGSFEKSDLLFHVASRVLQKEVGAIRAEGHRVVPGTTILPVPSEIEAAPEQLRDAWQMYQTAKGPFEKAFPQPAEVVDVAANERSFYKLIDAALAGEVGLYDEVREFGWRGANCLGITDTEDAQDVAVLLMLVRERKLDQAVGAALRVAGTEGSNSAPEVIAESIVQLLEACGVDWETIFAGAQVQREAREYSFGTRRVFVEALGCHGSDAGARLVHQLAQFSKAEARAEYVKVFDSWIEPADHLRKCDGREVSVGHYSSEKRSAPPLPRSIQEVSLRLTDEFAVDKCDERLAQYALHIFGKTQALSSIPALQALTRHGSSDVAEAAARVLCAMGSGTTAKPAAGPVRFQILLNGEPMTAGKSVAWKISFARGAASSTAEAQVGGIVELPRKYFSDPNRRPAEIEFRNIREYFDDATSPGADVESPHQHAGRAMTFATKVPPPSALEQETVVNVMLGRLEIVLTNVESLNGPPPDKAHLFLDRCRDAEPVSTVLAASGELSELSFGVSGVNVFREGDEVAARPAIIVPSVQHGCYEIVVGAPGAQVWHGRVTIAGDNSTVEAYLQPGSDVRFKIVTPNGQRGPWGPLFKDGKQLEPTFDWDTSAYRALPRGSYVMQIAGSDAFDDGRGSRKLKRGPDEVPYSGAQVAFTIDAQSPPVIDLGEIRLQPLTP